MPGTGNEDQILIFILITSHEDFNSSRELEQYVTMKHNFPGQ